MFKLIVAALIALTVSSPVVADDYEVFSVHEVECKGLGWFSKDNYKITKFMDRNHAGKLDVFYTIHQNDVVVVDGGSLYDYGSDKSLSWVDDDYSNTLVLDWHGQFKIVISEIKWSASKGKHYVKQVNEYCKPLS